MYGATRAEVVAKLDDLRALVARGPGVEVASLKLGEFLQRWLRDIAGPRARPSTLRVYEWAVKPAREQLGGVPLRQLGPMHLQALMRHLEDKGASCRARQMIFTYLKGALADAVRMRLIVSNPAEALDRPRAPRPEIQALDSDQARGLLEAARASCRPCDAKKTPCVHGGDPYEALYAVAVGTGLRLGELFGLKSGDIDLERGVVHVRRTLVEDPSKGPVLSETKTARSRRKVDLPGFAVEALQRHRERLGAAPHPERLVFTSPEGRPMRRSNFHRRHWKPLLKRAGLPDVPLHALRHTAATLALQVGTNPKVVQERLGHSSVTLTLDTYSHAVPTLGREAAERVDELLREG